jgi:DNA-binding transcriptional MerR regulator
VNAKKERMRTETGQEMTWAAETLRRQYMPAGEIREVLTTRDHVTVHRHLELHRERLQEQLAEQQKTIVAIERFLTDDTGSTR